MKTQKVDYFLNNKEAVRDFIKQESQKMGISNVEYIDHLSVRLSDNEILDQKIDEFLNSENIEVETCIIVIAGVVITDMEKKGHKFHAQKMNGGEHVS